MKTGKIIAICGLALSLAAAGAGLFSGCGSKKYNILLITLDTTRADHLRCYGYKQIETPGLNELAREGVLFEHAYSQAPLTLPAHTSIMSGTVPMHHGVIDNGGYKVPDELVTLAEVMKGQGYDTAAFISAKVLDKDFNLNQGFDLYNQEDINPQIKEEESLLVAERKGDKTTDSALKWLTGRRGKPWFAWVHYYDPHMNYNPPEPFKSLYPNPYDGEIAFMDSQVKRLMDQLRTDDAWKDTIIIAVGDHGESLGEHGERTHSNFLYNATAHVPFIIRIPGIKPGARVASAVSQIDIMPTLLTCLGIEVPTEVEGESLLPLMQGQEPPADRFAFLQSDSAFLHYGWSPLAGIADNRYKYIKAPKPELYDLQADPGELKNLYTPENKTALQLKAKLDELTKEYEKLKIKPQVAQTDAKLQAQIEALGYVVNGSNGNPKLAATKDPKDFIDLFGPFVGLFMFVKTGDYEKVLSLSDLILKRDPTNPTAMFRRAWALFGLGRFDDSLAAYMLFFKTHNDTYQGWLHVGHIYIRRSQDAKINYRDQEWKDNLVKAREAYLKAISIEDHPDPWYYLGRIEMDAGNMDAARKIFEGKELANTEWSAMGMGKYYQLLGRPGMAEAEYARIENREDQPNVIYWQEYAQFLLSQKRPAEALDLLQKALKKEPALTTDTGFLRALASARAATGASASPAGSGSGSALPGATAN